MFKFEIFCPVCETQVTLTTGEQHVQLQTKQTSPAEDVVQDVVETELKKETLDKSRDSGVIEDDNPIIMDNDDILDEDSEEELIAENDIDIPDIENEELIEDDDNDFLVEEDDIEDSDLIITPKSDDE